MHLTIGFHYRSYKERYCKRAGNESMDTISELVQDYVGERYNELYAPFKRLIPTVPEGDQYAAWDRPAINTLTSKTLFAYFLDVILSHCDTLYQLDNTVAQQIASYAHMHVLPPADIMMAKAGYDHRGIDEERVKILFDDVLYNAYSLIGIERVILNDKTVCLLQTKYIKYINKNNTWKLFATLENDLSQQLLNVLIDDQLLEKLYSSSKIIYNFSKSKNALFGGTPSEIYVGFAPFRKVKPYECLQKFGIDVMEEALEKTYAKIIETNTPCTHDYLFSHIENGLGTQEV